MNIPQLFILIRVVQPYTHSLISFKLKILILILRSIKFYFQFLYLIQFFLYFSGQMFSILILKQLKEVFEDFIK